MPGSGDSQPQLQHRKEEAVCAIQSSPLVVKETVEANAPRMQAFEPSRNIRHSKADEELVNL